MTFRDSDGRITIDEAAAQADIRRLKESVEYMRSTLRYLDEILSHTDELSGNTKTQIVDACSILKEKINNSIRQTLNAADAVSSTVDKYRRIDADIKRLVDMSGR